MSAQHKHQKIQRKDTDNAITEEDRSRRATGRVGHHTVDVLQARGHDVVPMSRSQGVDIITGKGLAAALAGVDCVIDAATGPSPEQQAATAFFTTAARNLHQAGQRPR